MLSKREKVAADQRPLSRAGRWLACLLLPWQSSLNAHQAPHGDVEPEVSVHEGKFQVLYAHRMPRTDERGEISTHTEYRSSIYTPAGELLQRRVGMPFQQPARREAGAPGEYTHPKDGRCFCLETTRGSRLLIPEDLDAEKPHIWEEPLLNSEPQGNPPQRRIELRMEEGVSGRRVLSVYADGPVLYLLLYDMACLDRGRMSQLFLFRCELADLRATRVWRLPDPLRIYEAIASELFPCQGGVGVAWLQSPRSTLSSRDYMYFPRGVRGNLMVAYVEDDGRKQNLCVAEAIRAIHWNTTLSAAALGDRILVAYHEPTEVESSSVGTEGDSLSPLRETYAHIGTEFLSIVDIVRLDAARTRPTRGLHWRVPGAEMDFSWVDELDLWVGQYEVSQRQYTMLSGQPREALFHEWLQINSDYQAACSSYDDATAFAARLTEHERMADRLPRQWRYRLPSGEEWTAFASCGRTRTYPWGDSWPPHLVPSCDSLPNLYDRSADLALGFCHSRDGYLDGFPVSCPTYSSAANEWNLYGVAGNVWEWTSEARGDKRALRGGSWTEFELSWITTRHREWHDRAEGGVDVGFRLVLEPRPERDADDRRAHD